MSMQNNPITVNGLFVKLAPETEDLIDKHKENNSSYVIGLDLDDHQESIEMYLLKDDGTFDWNTDIYSGQEGIIIPFKTGTLFQAPYPSMLDLINQLKAQYGAELPKDFDYRGNLVHTSWVEWS